MDININEKMDNIYLLPGDSQKLGTRAVREVWMLSNKKVRCPYFFLETKLKENMTFNGVECWVAMSTDAYMYQI